MCTAPIDRVLCGLTPFIRPGDGRRAAAANFAHARVHRSVSDRRINTATIQVDLVTFFDRTLASHCLTTMSNEKLEVVQYIDAPWNPLPLPFYPFTGDTSTGEGFGKHIAGEMAVVHNVIIRALNTLYINAPLVKSSKGIQDFTGYALEVLQVIHEHHETEEAFMFPPLEGKVDMNINVEQHRKFEDGMEKFESYVKAARNGEQGYDSERWRYLLQEFATPLIFHLGEEVRPSNHRLTGSVCADIVCSTDQDNPT